MTCDGVREFAGKGHRNSLPDELFVGDILFRSQDQLYIPDTFFRIVVLAGNCADRFKGMKYPVSLRLIAFPDTLVIGRSWKCLPADRPLQFHWLRLVGHATVLSESRHRGDEEK